ncbi:MAG TPA: hypothetical protein VND64_31305 [Pirellulales bacterium]|nr:hypothetical protein [Pirellulales bacterium]
MSDLTQMLNALDEGEGYGTPTRCAGPAGAYHFAVRGGFRFLTDGRAP